LYQELVTNYGKLELAHYVPFNGIKIWPGVTGNVITEAVRPHNETTATCPNYFS
jgi:hypothetical protein